MVISNLTRVNSANENVWWRTLVKWKLEFNLLPSWRSVSCRPSWVKFGETRPKCLPDCRVNNKPVQLILSWTPAFVVDLLHYWPHFVVHWIKSGLFGVWKVWNLVYPLSTDEMSCIPSEWAHKIFVEKQHIKQVLSVSGNYALPCRMWAAVSTCCLMSIVSLLYTEKHLVQNINDITSSEEALCQCHEGTGWWLTVLTSWVFGELLKLM